MGNNIIIGIVVSGIFMATSLFFNESIKNIIKNFSSNLSKKQTNIIFVGLLLFFFTVPITIGIFLPDAFYEDETTGTNPIDSVSINGNDKSDAIQIAEDLISIDERFVYTKMKKDSIKAANREQIWVYQIGTPKSGLNEL